MMTNLEKITVMIKEMFSRFQENLFFITRNDNSRFTEQEKQEIHFAQLIKKKEYYSTLDFLSYQLTVAFLCIMSHTSNSNIDQKCICSFIHSLVIKWFVLITF